MSTLDTHASRPAQARARSPRLEGNLAGGPDRLECGASRRRLGLP